MEVYYRKEDIENALTWAFEHRYRRKDVALTGILLARPEDSLAKDDILPHLAYWHHRSDNHTDFFCAGYAPTFIDSTVRAVGVTIDRNEWGFSLPAFMQIVEDIEQRTRWDYNGDPWLFLLNSYFDGKRAHLDYVRGLRINLRKGLSDESFQTPTQLADAVFQFAKRSNEDLQDPVWELSDHFGRRVIKRGIKDSFLAWLPEWVRPATKEAMHYAVYELPE